MLFNNELFLVTGASSGIGASISSKLIENGARVIGVARDIKKLKIVRDSLTNQQNFYIEPFDLNLKEEDLNKFLKGLYDKYGKFSGLAYCAGINGLKPLRITDEDFLLKTFKIHYFSAILCSKFISNKKYNVGKNVSIVFMSSWSAIRSAGCMTAYAGAKSALIGSCLSMSKELAPNVRVNCISPGLVETPLISDVSRQAQEGLYPLGFGAPEDISEMALYLLSNKAKWITGSNFVLDGGRG